jgi:hypothetical protein
VSAPPVADKMDDKDTFGCEESGPPEESRGVVATIKGFATDRDMEVLEIAVPLNDKPYLAAEPTRRVFASVDGDAFARTPAVVANLWDHADSPLWSEGASTTEKPIVATVFVRRPRAAHPTPLDATLYLTAPYFIDDTVSRHGAQIVHFTAEWVPRLQPERNVLQRWAYAFAREMRYAKYSGPESPWQYGNLLPSAWEQFAGARIIEQYLNPRVSVQASGGYRDPSRPLEETLGVLSGARSVYGALRNREVVASGRFQQNRSIAFSEIEPAQLTKHRFTELLAGLRRTPPEEPMANAAPAEFWYLRANDIASAFVMADQMNSIGSPALRMLGGAATATDAVERYETQLGLKRTELSAALGPALVSSVAVVGSDPYFSEGTDITLIFALKSSDAFRNALSVMTAMRGKTHGGVETSELSIEGTPVKSTVSKDRAIQQLFALSGDYGVVSNSAGALARVLATMLGRHDALSHEADFRYMLARDAQVPADIFVYMSDRFISDVAGPRQRILESRRVRAQAELFTPGFAAMLFGHLEGRAPASLTELLDSRLLNKKELRHGGGEPIVFVPGSAPHSAWGSPGFLTPIIDLPSPKTATVSERDAYERWAEQYAAAWNGIVDPMSLRISLNGKPLRKMSAELRVMPLIGDRDYLRYLDVVADAGVTAAPVVGGLRLLAGLSRDARLRRELNSEMQPEHLIKGLTLDIIGSWALVGANDSAATAKVLKRAAERSLHYCGIENNEQAELAFKKLPVYGGIEITSYPGAAIALAALRQLAVSTLSDGIRWEQIEKERSIPVTRVQIGSLLGSRGAADVGPEQTIYFALLRDAFYLSQDEATLRGLIRAHLDGQGPKVSTESSGGPHQVTVELAPRSKGALEKLLLETMLRMTTMQQLELSPYAVGLYRGVPDLVAHPERFSTMAEAYLGFVPVLKEFPIVGYGPEGVIFDDGATPIRPKPATVGEARRRFKSLFEQFTRLSAALAFDREGVEGDRPLRSLHTRVEVEYQP